MPKYFEVADPDETAMEVHRLLVQLMTQIKRGRFVVQSSFVLFEEIQRWIDDLEAASPRAGGLLPHLHDDGSPVVKGRFGDDGQEDVVGYVSFDDPEAQELAIRRHAARKGLNVVGVFENPPEDRATIVWQRGVRSGLLHARAEVRKLRSIILVRRLSDISDSLPTVLRWLSESQILPFAGLLSVEEGIDTTSPGGSVFAQLAGQIAEDSRRRSREQPYEVIEQRIAHERSLGADDMEIRRRLASGAQLETFAEWKQRTSSR